jgi:hypothetical protein
MSSTSEKQNGTFTKKSGKGSSHGVISEVSKNAEGKMDFDEYKKAEDEKKAAAAKEC